MDISLGQNSLKALLSHLSATIMTWSFSLDGSMVDVNVLTDTLALHAQKLRHVMVTTALFIVLDLTKMC